VLLANKGKLYELVQRSGLEGSAHLSQMAKDVSHANTIEILLDIPFYQ